MAEPGRVLVKVKAKELNKKPDFGRRAQRWNYEVQLWVLEFEFEQAVEECINCSDRKALRWHCEKE